MLHPWLIIATPGLFVQHVAELWQYPSASFIPTAEEYDRFCAALCRQSKEQLQTFMQCHAVNGVAPEPVMSKGMAADCILSFARQQAINLIVMGTHGFRGFERLMLGSVTEKVLRTAQCPVLAVPKLPPEAVASATAKGEINLRQILACTDFSEFSESALDYAASVAEKYEADLTLLHVIADDSMPGFAEETANAYKLLNEFAARAKSSSKIATVVEIGRPFREIVQIARDRRVDLVIMTVRGRNSLDDAVFGSTTYRVIQSGVCPVLAIRP